MLISSASDGWKKPLSRPRRAWTGLIAQGATRRAIDRRQTEQRRSQIEDAALVVHHEGGKLGLRRARQLGGIGIAPDVAFGERQIRHHFGHGRYRFARGGRLRGGAVGGRGAGRGGG